MEFAGTVILYHPDADVVDNIKTYASLLGKIYIIDNTEKATDHGSWFAALPNAVYLPQFDNQGTAQRLNEAANLAMADGFRFLLTMDQDSRFQPGGFALYLKKVENWLATHTNAGIFAVNFQPDFVVASPVPQEVLSTITSGSIVNLAAFQKVQGWDERLFLDLVDADFCYRLHAAGFKTILFSDIILVHTIGHFVVGRSLLTFKKSNRRIHPFVRIYYLVRNSFFLLKQPYVNKEARKEIYNCLKLLKNNIIYNKTGRVLQYIYKGWSDYRKGRMGKIEL